MRISSVWFQKDIPGRIHTHAHREYEFHYISDGTALFQAGEKMYTLKQGDFFFTGPGERHHIFRMQRPYGQEHAAQYLVMATVAPQDHELHELLQKMLWPHRPLAIGPLKRLFFEQLRQRVNGDRYMQEAARHHFCALLYDCMAAVQRPWYSTAGESMIETALALLQSALDRPVGIEELCRQVNMSRSHFIRSFTRVVGMPPAKYHTRLRIEQAALLLRETPDPVNQVARELGFEDPLYFSRLFKKWMGVAPLQFRKRADT